jgi:hypothetical protein
LLKSESLHSSLEECKKKVDARVRPKAASYETAIASGILVDCLGAFALNRPISALPGGWQSSKEKPPKRFE